MLQRAAGNAYSWWWASHIRTKQSKWLEQNLHDMEERVNNTIQIIDEDGDTFAKRAEMYYKKRPELLTFVEESYRSYRALAERYDHLSRELQSANRAIATAFPERVQLSMDEEDEENVAQTSKDTPAAPKAGVPKVPKIPKLDFRSSSMVTSRKKQLKRISSAAKGTGLSRSGLSKSEALGEIDKHQKEILALQTEAEFVKSSYENAYAKYWEIENNVAERQQKVSSLQDEFGIGTFIDDNEARTLMATTALQSCQETLVMLQEKHQQSADEAKIDHQRIKEAQEKFATLKMKFPSEQTGQHDPISEHELEISDLQLNNVDQQENDLELLREKIKKQLDVDSNNPLTVSQLAEKIDELVSKVVTLETTVSSQNALVKRLRSETDELHAHIRSQEEEDYLIDDSDSMRNRIKSLEEELCRVKSLSQSVQDQNKGFLTQFTEASCNIDHFIQKLQKVKLEMEEEVEDLGLVQEVKGDPDAKTDNDVNDHEAKFAPGDDTGFSEDTPLEQEGMKHVLNNSVNAKGENDFESSTGDPSTQEKKDEMKKLSETTDSNLDDEIEEMVAEEEGELPNWRQQFINGLEDREKIILEEYKSIIKNYKEVKMKLGDVEKKNRDGFFELALQIRELKNALFQRDEEIQSLRRKVSFQKNDPDETLTEHNYSNQAPESINLAASSLDSTLSSPVSHQQEGSNTPGDGDKAKHVDRPPKLLTIEDKIRSDINELLEENLEFWLRFSTSIHQIKKFQTSVRDLKAELLKLRDKMKQDGSGKQRSLNSDGRPIYSHLREIQTELALWLENNAVLKEEVQGRYSSLCNIQQEISRVSNAAPNAGEELNEYQAAKYQGEILNMKQENTKVADELKAGLDRVSVLKAEVDNILAMLDQELGISASRTPMRSPSSRPKIPLRLFLFGAKLKKQKQQKQQKLSFLSCMNPALQKQYSDLAAADHLPQ
ncbi:KIP1 domain-containing protein [Cephalotus follicularis]|uniref:KIP1 domain-containing protein n=1 Tax=Cephalotus follicularis TaxID=3775 RepID=A0A1Q3BFR5_CEPFO|nr:KIP1 domain-containing protein [Cephalotus follicularis]